LPVNILWHLGAIVQPPPETYRLTGLDAADAIERFLR
jgi:hypothetical protein